MSSLAPPNPDELRAELVKLGERWQKAEKLADKGLLPDTPQVAEELSKISARSLEIWEFLKEYFPEKLEGIDFLGFP
jgi:hypothetical protein